MNANSIKGLKWLVILLAALNITLIITIWMTPKVKEMKGPESHHKGPAKMIIAELHFNEKQIEEFNALKDEHRATVEELKAAGKKQRDVFFALLSQENPDPSIVNSKADSISANQKAIEMVTFQHFKKVRALCDTEQKKKFDEIIGEILQNMMRPDRHGPPHHMGPQHERP
jgi:Spy/CpxP family protein refolding chaperone